MDDRALAFVEVMAALAVVAVLSFLIYLVAQYGRRGRTVNAGTASPAHTPQWYEFLLAAVVLAIIAAALLWRLFPSVADQAAVADWRGDTQTFVFFAVMAVIAVLALLAFLAMALLRASGPRASSAAAPRSNGASGEAAAEDAVQQSGLGIRLVGLLALALAFLALNWIYVPSALQYDLMLYLIYPAALAVTLVLLFDKATRQWSAKGGGESLREWLFCDAIAFLLVLGFLNLRQWQGAESYAALFWDLLAVVLLLATFWIVDRTASRFRFLVAYGFLVLLPILLWIWRFVLEVAAAEELSWWSTIWPALILAAVFFVLEGISLVASANPERQLIPALKDALYFILFAVLLIVAIPAAPA